MARQIVMILALLVGILFVITLVTPAADSPEANPIVSQTPTSIASAPPTPTASSSSASIPTASPSPSPIPTPSASPTPLPCSASLTCLREHALELINDDRTKYGFPPVTLGSNPAAQLHAQDMVEHGYLGHWWLDGRKPYMVYTQTGGTSYVSENASYSGWTDQEWESDNCDSWLVRCNRRDPQEAITQHQWSMMYDDAHSDWGHRDNILMESHRAVNIGIFWNEKRVAFVQHFEGGAVTVLSGPSLNQDWVLDMELVKQESDIDIGGVVSLYYDPTPVRMSVEQIDALDSYCVGGGQTTRCGEPVVRVLKPLGANQYYTDLDHNDIVADTWIETDSGFRFSTDVSEFVQRPGVYTVIVWRHTGEARLSEQLVELSVFVD